MKLTILTLPDDFIHPHCDDLSANKTAVDFAVHCVIQGCTEVSVLGGLRDPEDAGRAFETLDSFGINRRHLRMFPADPNTRKAGLNAPFYKKRLEPAVWRHLCRQDCIVVSYANPQFAGLIRRRHDTIRLAVDFYNAPAYYEVLNFMQACAVSFLSGDEGAIEFFSDYSSYLGAPIVIAARTGRITVLHKGQKFRVRPVTDDTDGRAEVDRTAFRAAFLCEWLKSKDIRKAMWQAAGAAFHTYTSAGVV